MAGAQPTTGSSKPAAPAARPAERNRPSGGEATHLTIYPYTYPYPYPLPLARYARTFAAAESGTDGGAQCPAPDAGAVSVRRSRCQLVIEQP